MMGFKTEILELDFGHISQGSNAWCIGRRNKSRSHYVWMTTSRSHLSFHPLKVELPENLEARFCLLWALAFARLGLSKEFSLSLQVLHVLWDGRDIVDVHLLFSFWG